MESRGTLWRLELQAGTGRCLAGLGVGLAAGSGVGSAAGSAAGSALGARFDTLRRAGRRGFVTRRKIPRPRRAVGEGGGKGGLPFVVTFFFKVIPTLRRPHRRACGSPPPQAPP